MVSILGNMSDTNSLEFIQRKANGRVKRGHGSQGAMWQQQASVSSVLEADHLS